MFLSIIIPAWNEAAKIAGDITEIDKFAATTGISIELIIVDDGSEDHTFQIANNTPVTSSLTKKVIGYASHRGKGYAVRKGISESKGDLIMFMDSGQNVPSIFITIGINQIEDKACDILIGSRFLPTSVIKKKLIWYRQVTSLLFRKMVRWYLKIPPYISDSQCGYKFFKGELGRELFRECQSNGFVFDLELILRAQKLAYKICEFPIEWHCDRDSRLSLSRAFFPIFRELKVLKRAYQ
jgi:glycosyltransferase involved in cell wall biosynthesis